MARSQVVISEIHYDPIGGSTNEFVELRNVGTNAANLGNWRFMDGITYLMPNPTVLPAGAYLVIAADRLAFAARYPAVTNLAPGAYSGQLSNQGEHLALADATTTVVFEVTYNNASPWPLAAAGLGSSLVLLDPFASPTNPANWGASAEVHGSPGGPGGQFVRDIVINEVLAHTDPPQEDAVELFNLSTNAVDLTGWFLSDDGDLREKYRFPTNSLIAPGGYLVVYQEQLTNSTGALIPFSISSKGDDLYLSQGNTNGDLVRFVDEVTFDASKNGVSFGRWPDGTGDLLPLTGPTFGVASPVSLADFRTGTGAANVGPWVGPVVINEIMYHPSTSAVPGRMAVEYVELLNASGAPVPLYNVDFPDFTWSLTGGIDFTFPTNLTLAAGQYLVVVGTNDLAGFRAGYNVPTNAIVLGPWSNSLNNAGDTIRIRVPNSPEGVSNIAARYVEDEVKFNDQLPWPLAADGLGGSLERISATSYGNTPGNWHAAPGIATPGTNNSTYVPPGSIVISEIMAANRHTLTDEDGDYSDWIELYNTQNYDIPLRGWYLTDSAAMPTQWTFPAVTIPARGYLVVFADMKNRTNDAAHLHTNFQLSEAGEYLALFRPDLVREFAFDPGYPPQFADIGYGCENFGNRTDQPVAIGTPARYLAPTNATMLATNWNLSSFNDAAWPLGTNGFGYDTAVDYRAHFVTDLQGAMLNKAHGVFVRHPFLVTNTAAISQLQMKLKFEDGFMAWLNGVLVASNNVPASVNWGSDAVSARNEALAIGFDSFDFTPFLYLLANGTNLLALQGLNAGSNSSDFLLTTELRLISSGGSTSTAGLTTGYLSPATPNGYNGASLPGVAPAPALSYAGGLFVGSVTVTASCSLAGATMRYTTDGSEPSLASTPYSGPLTFSDETELRIRAFASGLLPSPVVGAVFRKSFLGINEFLASNATATPEINDFSAYPDWIELYNASTGTINLSGYHLSDSPDQPFKWKIPAGASIPAGGCFLVWADGYNAYPGIAMTRPFWPYSNFVTRSYHAGFKLSSLSEYVCLFSPNGSLIDSINYGPQSVDISYGRYPDGAASLTYFGEPTAGTNNTVAGLPQNLRRAPKVVIAPTNDTLMVTSAVQIVLSSGPDVTEIRYTTNGAMPNSSSLLYTQSFTVVTSAVIRARAFAADKHPGPIATKTVLFTARVPDLPILSVVIDPKLLYDPVIGIYSNVLKEREIPGSIQFCTTPSNTGFQIDAGFRIYGLNTFLYAQKPFTVYLNGDYGPDALGYQLFPDKPIGYFDRFILRNGNDDWPTTFLRDTLGQRLLKGIMDTATQGYRPCAIYLNGSYYGLINIQEKMDEMYCVKNYGVDEASIDFFEMDGTATTDDWILDAGTDVAWNNLVSFLTTNNMANPTNYAYVKTQVDVEDLVDYVAGQVYAYDSSWFHNRKWWRDRNPGGKWRWCFVDLDRALVYSAVSNNTISSMGGGSRSMLVYRECLSNAAFRAYAAQRIMAHLSGSFSTNRTLPIIDAEAASIRNELQSHIAQYSSRGGISSIGTWDTRINEIRLYAKQRPTIALQQVASYFSSGQVARVALGTTGGSGKVLANYVALDTAGPSTLAGGIPVQFTAIPDIGQTFVRWEVGSNEVVTLVSTGAVWRYYDTVTNEMTGWSGTNHDDSAWPAGPAQLGYGDGDESTVVGHGPSATNFYLTTYFRTAFSVADPAAFTNLQLEILRDDGAVVYLNGREVVRDNMPAGTVTIATPALSNTASETAFYPFTLAASNLVAGTNTLAVEIHQVSTASSDISFDLRLSAGRMSAYTSLTNGPDMQWTPRDGDSIRAVFAPAGVSLVPSVLTGATTLAAAQSPYYATGDIFVPSNATLDIEAGVDLLMPDLADIRVQGRFRVLGTSNAPVRILPNSNATSRTLVYHSPQIAGAGEHTPRWGAISFEQATHTGELAHLILRGATLCKTDPVNQKAAISGLRSDLWLDHLDLDDLELPVFVQEGSSTVLQNSRIHLRITGDGINLKRTAYARVEGNEFIGAFEIDADAIDYDGILGGIIRGNHIHDFLGDNDDAIDIGEKAIGILIESNLIERISDKSASVGQASTAIYRRNIARDCSLGLGIKDLGSYALIENSTFHKCAEGVALYEKNRGDGGGLADIRNTIFSETVLVPVSVDVYSTATVTYCLSDTLPVDGIGNVNAQPQFLNAATNNFRLQAGSAAIDAGSPTDPADPDGTRLDIGALPFDWRDGHVMVSEIHYNPGAMNQSEYVELHNPGGATLDLTGYRFSKGVVFEFPAGTLLPAGGYLVLAASTNGLTGVTNLLLWTSGVLDNAGETLELKDAASNEIDRVAYASFDPWPSLPDGSGPSLSVINPRRDNAVPSNWYASGATNGTPGSPFDHALPGPLSFSRGTNGAMTVGFDGLNNLLYVLEFTPTLSPPNWQPVQSGSSAANARITLGHTPGSTSTNGIYRLRVETP